MMANQDCLTDAHSPTPVHDRNPPKHGSHCFMKHTDTTLPGLLLSLLPYMFTCTPRPARHYRVGVQEDWKLKGPFASCLAVKDLMKLRLVLRNTGLFEAYCSVLHKYMRCHSHERPLRPVHVYFLREQLNKGSTSYARALEQFDNRPIRYVFGGNEVSAQFDVALFRMTPTRFRVLTRTDVGRRVYLFRKDAQATAPRMIRTYSSVVDILDLPDTDFACVGVLEGFRERSVRCIWQNKGCIAAVAAEDGTTRTFNAMLEDSNSSPLAVCLRENRSTMLCVQVFCERCSSHLPPICVDDASHDLACVLRDATHQILRHMWCASCVSSLDVVCG
jgi:limonene-1,2-epoxide hydrolase